MEVSEILSIVITAVLLPLVGWLMTVITESVKEKTHNAKLDKYLDQAQDAITTAVQDTMQTYVDSVKTAGDWNAATKKIAFEKARAKAIELMGVGAYKAIGELFDSAEQQMEVWLSSKLEAATREEKLKSKLAQLGEGECEA